MRCPRTVDDQEPLFEAWLGVGLRSPAAFALLFDRGITRAARFSFPLLFGRTGFVVVVVALIVVIREV